MGIARARIPLLAAGTAVLLLAGILVYQRSGPAGNTSSAAEQTSTSKPPVRPDKRASIPHERASIPGLQNLSELPAPVEPPHPPGSPDHREWIDKRITELDALAWFDDSGSLGKILTELRNPLPEIRTAALEATREFGSRDAIPYLEAISKSSADPLEQKALGELIEFLNLPTLLEISDHDAIE